MKQSVIAVLTVLILAPMTAWSGYGSSGSSNTTAGFEKLKSMAGEWETKTPDGAVTHIAYNVVSNGTAVMETIDTPGDADMITMYHLDGDRIMLTHYCAMGNQPVMKLEKATANELRFGFAGGTNMDPAKDVHIHSGRLRWVEGGRLESEWDVYEGPKQTATHKFFLARKP